MINLQDYTPQRIVCLTEEPTELLYLLGEENRIVGISGFTVRPPQAKKEKPKLSTFRNAKIDKIIELQPDLVIGFSDIQADIAKELVSKGITVLINNHRSVDEIYKMMIQLGCMVGKTEEVIKLVNQIKSNIATITKENHLKAQKPKIYFEEWHDPIITGIRWVSELIELAGGIDIYPEHKNASMARDRIVEDNNDVVRRNPDIILASWCGKEFKKDQLIARENWETINAVKNDFVFEIKSSVILQPGPACLTEGIEQITAIINKWHLST